MSDHDEIGFLAYVPKWCLVCNRYFEASVETHSSDDYHKNSHQNDDGRWDYVRLDTLDDDGALEEYVRGHNVFHHDDEAVLDAMADHGEVDYDR